MGRSSAKIQRDMRALELRGVPQTAMAYRQLLFELTGDPGVLEVSNGDNATVREYIHQSQQISAEQLAKSAAKDARNEAFPDGRHPGSKTFAVPQPNTTMAATLSRLQDILIDKATTEQTTGLTQGGQRVTNPYVATPNPTVAWIKENWPLMVGVGFLVSALK